MSQLESRNPYSAEVLERYPAFELGGLDGLLTAMSIAQRDWEAQSVAARTQALGRVADTLRARADDLARLMTLEMGKPLRESHAEVEKCAWVCDYYAAHAEAQLADAPVDTGRRRSYACYRPLGVLLAIMPWNFPLWQVFRCLAPAFAAGNALVLKHASNVPGCALAIEACVRAAGLPEGLMRSVLLPSAEAEKLIRHPLIQGLSFTGSSDAGRKIAALAGRELKKHVLELGGSDPYLVLDDADIDAAAATCVASRLINGGQSCIAAKRFIVQRRVYPAFLDALSAGMRARRPGDPLQPDTDLGPLARPDLKDKLHDQVQRSLEAGARLVCGGSAQGNAYAPTVLAGVRPGMPAFDEELFGPVAAVIEAGSEEQAIALANHSPFGLGAAVFTGDLSRGERIARLYLQAGCCFVNAQVVSDPRLPFGGIKASGYGRELGELGIREFTNIKTVVVA